MHNLLLVGHGGISEAYVRAVEAIPSARICGVVGRNDEKARAFAEQKGIAVWGTKLQETAEQAKATAAIICTPNAAHYEGVMAASAAGLHCLCEKPLHIDPERQQEMIASCNEHEVKLAVSYMRRFTPHLAYIKSLIDAGSLGRMTVIDVTLKHFRDAAYYDSWHGTKEHDGGGPFIQQGSHMIDMALWLCGGYSDVLQASLFQAYHHIEVEDHGYATIRYANGAVGMIEASTACVGSGWERIEISGTKGTITANFQGIIDFNIPGLELPDFQKPDNELLMRLLVEDFLSSIEESRSPLVSGHDGKLATELVTDIYRRAGEPILLF